MGEILLRLFTVLVAVVRWQAAGLPRAIVASISIFVPAALLVYFIARGWAKYEIATLIKAMEADLIPVAEGMKLAATGTILKSAEGGVWAWDVAIFSTVALLYTRVSPFFAGDRGCSVLDY